MELPLGLVALYWIRMFKPLVERGLPQRPGEAMGFVTPAFRALGPLAPHDLRPGARFGGDARRGAAPRAGGCGAADRTMPATHLTFADNAPVFPTAPRRPPRATDPLTLGAELLWGYGTTAVPLHVWQALRRMAAWIEPMLVAEWVRLVQAYGARAGRAIPAEAVMRALESGRAAARHRAGARPRRRPHRARRAVACVWSGDAAAGPRRGDRPLPALVGLGLQRPVEPAARIARGEPTEERPDRRRRGTGGSPAAHPRPGGRTPIVGAEPALRTRFAEEARTTLPLAQGLGKPQRPGRTTASRRSTSIFAALEFRRLRLRQETQLPEWAGAVR